jgi:predicted nucleic acid-binding Zn ribbon protein
MADESEQLRRVVKWRASYQAKTVAKLGDVLSELMRYRVLPQQTTYGMVTEAFSQMLPAELCQHCKIVDISHGRIKVITDSPSYVYELQLLSGDLVKELAKRCPQARIKEIKYAVG